MRAYLLSCIRIVHEEAVVEFKAVTFCVFNLITRHFFELHAISRNNSVELGLQNRVLIEEHIVQLVYL